MDFAMKLTWFGGTTIRIHVGGCILVADASLAPPGIDPAELVSGADRAFGLAISSDSPAMVDLKTWVPPRIRPLDAGAPEATILGASPGVILVHANGERPLLLVAGELPALGRWARDAVLVLFGSSDQLAGRGQDALRQEAPFLLALAAAESELDAAVSALRPHLDATALAALEPGLGLEI
jgi:hypothetical protein